MKPKQTYSQRYPLAGNLAYCLGCTARRHFPLLCWCGLAVLIQVALPLLTAWMPKAVIEGISGGDWPGLARTILLFAGGNRRPFRGGTVFHPVHLLDKIPDERLLCPNGGKKGLGH